MKTGKPNELPRKQPQHLPTAGRVTGQELAFNSYINRVRVHVHNQNHTIIMHQFLKYLL